MTKPIYLFDWGDTLMEDTPGQTGKMKDWPEVCATEGAAEVLAALSCDATICIASGAQDSDDQDILAALERVGLAQYIDHCFCPATLGVGKGCPDFLPAVLARLCAEAEQVTMIGDSWSRDMEPALAMGLSAVWLNPEGKSVPEQSLNLRAIGSLKELI